MHGQIKLVRAVGSEFVARKLRSTALTVGVLAVIALIASLWLTTLSAWWWLLASVVIAADILLVLAYLLAAFVVGRLRPELSKAQATGVREFVDKLERVADSLGTPMFIIIFRVVRDTIWPRQPNYIQTVARDGTSLHTDLGKLQKLFAA